MTIRQWQHCVIRQINTDKIQYNFQVMLWFVKWCSKQHKSIIATHWTKCNKNVHNVEKLIIQYLHNRWSNNFEIYQKFHIQNECWRLSSFQFSQSKTFSEDRYLFVAWTRLNKGVAAANKRRFFWKLTQRQNKVIATTVIRPPDDSTWCAQSVFADLQPLCLG